ncbi:MAG: nucleotidyltransferase domain-containing protein [Campylobacterales bacterium]|nr:nucleotidyltransferase domain-containing protein [Campylobacterales bacterium]
MNKSEILDYLKDIKPTLEQKGVEKLGLFGSFAKDSQNEFSDIDIAFKLKSDFLKTYDVWRYFDLTKDIKELVSSKFHKKSDIFDLDSASDLREIIFKEVIYV